MKLMNLAVMSTAMLVGFVSSASAAPLCIAGGSMASYMALGSGGCMIGNELFANFVYGSTGHGTGVAVPNTNVFLTPVGAGTYNPGPGIVFTSSGWTVPSASSTTNSFVDSSIGFSVTSLDGAALIEDGTLSLLSFAAAGTGIVDITETINPSGTQLQVDSNGPFVTHKEFPPVATVSVLKDLLVTVPKSDNPASGSASISSFEEDFSQVPEPVVPALVGSGLLALGFWRRRSVSQL